jgi:hypothetical protein
MDKIWFGPIFAALIAQPASAQDYHKNFVECTLPASPQTWLT